VSRGEHPTRALEPGTVEGREQLSLVLPEPVWVDVEETGRLLGLARAALGRGRPADAAALARVASALASHGLLPGHEAAWLAKPRARLEDERVEALELAAQAGLALGGPELAAAEQAARAAVAAAPFRDLSAGDHVFHVAFGEIVLAGGLYARARLVPGVGRIRASSTARFT